MTFLVDVTNCDLCGGTDFAHWKTLRTQEWDAVRRFCRETGDIDSVYLRIPETFDLFRCRSCDLRFCNPRLPEEVVNAFYDDYMGGRFSSVLPPYDAGFRAQILWGVTDDLDRCRAAPFENRPVRALDVGCAHGPMLKCFRDKGWEAFGIEISENAARRAREYGTVWKGDVHQLLADQPDQSFDILTLVDVLEHLTSPSNVLAHSARVLRPGGAMFVEVPNSESGCDEMSRHFFLFPESCVRAMLNKHRFVDYRPAQVSDRYNPHDLPNPGRFHQVYVRKNDV